MYLGIDLGTNNTVVAYTYADSDDKLITKVIQMGQIFNDSWEKFPMLPSAVFFGNMGIVVGKEAKKYKTVYKNRVIFNPKQFAGTVKKWNIGGRDYEPKDILGMILKHCKINIDKEEDVDYELVVLTVPASFGPEQISDILAAAKLAGFDEVNIAIKHEPVAALLAYLYDNSENIIEDDILDFSTEKRIMVFDLGGGTCDTSIIDVIIRDDEINFKEIGIGIYQELGGMDFDDRFAVGLLNDFMEKKVNRELSKDEIMELFLKLRSAAEVIKEKISAKIEAATLADENIDPEKLEIRHVITSFFEGETYRIRMTKAKYDEYTRDFYNDENVNYKKCEEMEQHKNIIGVIRKTLDDYAIDKNSIDYVFATGGMSQLKTVQDKLKEYLGCEIIVPKDPMEIVARGASLYPFFNTMERKEVGHVIEDGFKNLDIENEFEEEIDLKKEIKTKKNRKKKRKMEDNMMMAEAIMLDMQQGLPKVIIPRKTEVPFESEILNEYKTTSPSGIKLNIYTGQDQYDSSMRIQKSFEKKFKYPVSSGTPFDIKYKINSNKAIEITIVIHDEKEQVLEMYIDSDLKIERSVSNPPLQKRKL
ncbi:molecular chaperone DnaK [Acetitomaculum ruminis DSM 5522]|uniref:Chaperone protein DnaK n=1 Tax=Acetitomaculum ruminis DSM 5522 TaxID=1120918 RepID=A0A1I0WKM3_9FIRM|nr:Hsp70 family protein [Acetitomaculum ruminis]SFA89345.1 molecular chaperone DnaK [Acetitomaculum ruminis DSM 5522]